MEKPLNTGFDFTHFIRNVMPRPIAAYAFTFIVLLLLKMLSGISLLSFNEPNKVANGVAEGLISVLKDDQNLAILDLFIAKSGTNVDKTVEIQNFRAGWGGLLRGGVSAAGGSLIFHGFTYKNMEFKGGPLDFKLSSPSKSETESAKERIGRFQVQGEILVDNKPVFVQLDFLSGKESFSVYKLVGKVKINNQIKSIE